MSEHGRAHRCTLHDLPGCTRRHQAVPYVRPERSDQPSGEWAPNYAAEVQPRPLWRWLVAAGAVLLVTAIIVILALQAGAEGAERFGPAFPVSTPSTIPWPGPSGGVE